MDEHAIEIHRIYVLENTKVKKVGQILFNKVLTIATKVKLNTFGWCLEGNYKALGFYAKMDLSHLTNIFTLGDDIQTDLLLKLEIINSNHTAIYIIVSKLFSVSRN
jgi:hypothetical protein